MSDPANPAALEKFRTPKDRMIAPQLDELLREIEQLLLLVVMLPLEPARSRCPGNRRCCCRSASAPIRRPRSSIGTPWERKSVVRKFRRCRARSLLISGSSVGPSAPQFHELIVVVAVAVVFAVGFVVLVVVADEIVQGEAVVRGDEIDAGVRASAAVLIQDRDCPSADTRSRRSGLRRLSKNAGPHRDISRSIPPRAPGNCRPDSRLRRRPTAPRSTSPARAPGPGE